MISTFNELMVAVKSYIKDEEDLRLIEKAYFFANKMHNGQFRKSGEPYIVHPLNVAYTMALFNSRAVSIVASLLHDTVEDVKGMSVEILIKEFGLEVANLVYILTKIKDDKVTLEEKTATNQRKVLDALENNFEAILIKLADSLHNMRTLKFQPRHKQIEIAQRTFLYANIAYHLGMNSISKELADLWLKYVLPVTYEFLLKEFSEYNDIVTPAIDEMIEIIRYDLNKHDISGEVLRRDNNLYSLYRNYIKGNDITEMHDLIGIKIITDNDIGSCNKALEIVHNNFSPYGNIQDFITMPKSNEYQSIHTIVRGVNNHLVQFRIRTIEMQKKAGLGIAYYNSMPNGHLIMQKKVLENLRTFKTVIKLSGMTTNNQEFIKEVENELGDNIIYVQDQIGRYYSLPEGSNIIDFAFRSLPIEEALKVNSALVNNHLVNLKHILKSDDAVCVLTDSKTCLKEELMESANTEYVRKLIKNN
jgi:GTP pyrophosphokinase